jgi:hypothetical protein
MFNETVDIKGVIQPRFTWLGEELPET